jgi:phage protein D
VAWRNVYRPHVQVVLPALESSAWIADMTTWMAEGAHQVAEITVHHVLSSNLPSQTLLSPAGVVWPESTPVHLRYGWWADDDGDVYGYVASSRVLASETDPTYGHAVVLPVVYTIVGPSMPMQSHANRLWSDVTASWVAREIAQEHNLQPAVETSSTRFPSLMQQSSDWAFLAELTSRIGYRLFLDGTTLWYVSRSTAMPTADGSVPTFYQYKTPGVINSIRSFAAVVGDTDPAGGVRSSYQAVGFNRSTSVTTLADFTMPRTDVRGEPVEPLVRRQYDARPTHSYAEASTLLSADTVYLWVEARLVVNGDPRLRPGCLVDLRGDGLGSQNTGLWMVRSAVHQMVVSHADPTRTDYTTTLVVGRNNAQALNLPVQGTFGKPAPTVLVGGQWRALTTGRL